MVLGNGRNLQDTTIYKVIIMQISISNTQELDVFSRGLATHLKLKPYHVKNGLTKLKGFQRIEQLELALGSASLQTQTPQLAQELDVTYVSAWDEGDVPTSAKISTQTFEIYDVIAVCDDGEVYTHLNNEYIEFQHDGISHELSCKDGQLTKEGKVAFKSFVEAQQIIGLALPQGAGKTIVESTTLNPSPILDDVDSHVMTEFMAWLEDNIESDSAIFFDGNGEVKSSAVLEILQDIVLINSNVSVNAKRIDSEIKAYEKDIEANVLADCEVLAISELSSENYSDAEDALINATNELKANDDLAKAIALLQQSGLQGVANEISSLVQTTMHVNFLNENT